ncbi:MAG: hypothetical protein K6F37_08310 [Lachnospiraceae bacterium]|nr:hypothetical protein [Lachnospiraceae bacterium]
MDKEPEMINELEEIAATAEEIAIDVPEAEAEIEIPDAPIEEPMAEEAPVEEPVIEEPVAGEAPVEEIVIPEAPIEESIIEDISEILTEEPVAEEPVIEEPVIEEPSIEEPVNEETIEIPIEEVATEEVPIEEPAIEESVAEETLVEEPVAEEPVVEEPVAEEPVVEKPVAEEPVVEEPVAEETLVEEPVAEEVTEILTEELIIEEAPVEEPAIEESPEFEIPEPEIDESSLSEDVKTMSVEEIASEINDYASAKTDVSKYLELSIGENGSSYIAIQVSPEEFESIVGMPAAAITPVMISGNCLNAVAEDQIIKKNLFTGECTVKNSSPDTVNAILQSITDIAECNTKKIDANPDLADSVKDIINITDESIDKLNNKLSERNSLLKIATDDNGQRLVLDGNNVGHSLQEVLWVLSL